jgi:hypothetical protein
VPWASGFAAKRGWKIYASTLKATARRKSAAGWMRSGIPLVKTLLAVYLLLNKDILRAAYEAVQKKFNRKIEEVFEIPLDKDERNALVSLHCIESIDLAHIIL